eukprot:11033180-Karenia_brevis.AAC.1
MAAVNNADPQATLWLSAMKGSLYGEQLSQLLRSLTIHPSGVAAARQPTTDDDDDDDEETDDGDDNDDDDDDDD